MSEALNVARPRGPASPRATYWDMFVRSNRKAYSRSTGVRSAIRTEREGAKKRKKQARLISPIQEPRVPRDLPPTLKQQRKGEGLVLKT